MPVPVPVPEPLTGLFEVQVPDISGALTLFIKANLWRKLCDITDPDQDLSPRRFPDPVFRIHDTSSSASNNHEAWQQSCCVDVRS